MDPAPTAVKGRRRYDSSRRLDLAQRRREAVLAAAREHFLRDGYAATTVGAVAAAAGVSVETIYKTFGKKPGLVRALQQEALAGEGDVPAPQRSDDMSAREAEPATILRRWADLTMEVAPGRRGCVLLVRSAAATDPEMAAVLGEINAERLDRMMHNARRLADRGLLRTDVTDEQARDVMFAFTAPELFEILVLQQHWSLAQFGDFIYLGLLAQIVDPLAAGGGGVALPSG